MRSFAFVCLFSLLALGAFATSDARAAAGPWAENDHGRLRLLSASDSSSPLAGIGRPALGPGKLLLGLKFELTPGWKIYWRSPGDAGFPPALDWSGSANLAAAEVEWPAPHRFSLFGLETFGYEGEVVLPLLASLEDPAAPLQLTARVDYLTCSDICIPYSETVRLDLPGGLASQGPEASSLAYYREQVPRSLEASDISLLRAELEGSMEAPELVVEVASASPLASPDLLIEGPPGFSFPAPETSFSDDGSIATLRVPVARAKSAGVLEGKRLTFTLIDGPRGVEFASIMRYADPLSVTPMTAAVTSETIPEQSLLVILGLALLGGLILNLMPCVLPVLSLKLLTLIKAGGRERGAVRAGFLASAAGIVFSFLLLASAAVAVKAAGLAVGWGIQFQQPIFLLFMALLVTGFAANLFGLFEIPLPAALATPLAGAGGSNLAGSFATGAFATLLATPCSAPFLGTAVGFALARDTFEIYLVFLFLGIGLALPYAAVALWPGLAARLPKPGGWMVHLRRILGLALLATAVWLLSVLTAQIGIRGALLAGFLLAVLLAVAAYGRRNASAASLTALVLAVALFVFPLRFASEAPASVASDAWPPLDPAAITEQVAAGNSVFVDVTADWCITCQVNKKLVLENPAVAERLADAGIDLQRGDWTLPSDEISAYLASFERYGIPFNAVYGPGAPKGLLLPELLDVDSVLKALDKAAGSAVN